MGEKRENREKNCTTCVWYAHCTGVCCNAYSEHVADFTDEKDVCEYWEGTKWR